MKEGFLQERGIAYQTNEFRPGRSTIVLIHGLSGTLSAWKPFEDGLEPSYNIVSYDLRGHGLSKKYTKYEDYELAQSGEDLYVLLTHLNVQRCTLVAHSFGSLAALEFLHRHQDMIESVIFLSPTYRLWTMARTRISYPFLALSTALWRLIPYSPNEGGRLNYVGFAPSPDWSLRRIVPEIRNMSLRLYLYCLQQLYAFAHDEWWQEIKVPVLIVHGTRDTFNPLRYGIGASKIIPNAKLLVIQGANHMLVLNNVSEIVEIIKNFVPVGK